MDSSDPTDPRDDDASGGNDATPFIGAIVGIAVGVIVVLSVIGIFV